MPKRTRTALPGLNLLRMPLLVVPLLGGCGQPEVTIPASDAVTVAPTQNSRERRRMNIDQLHASMMQVSGGLDWTEEIDQEAKSLFSHLSITLGQPDYLASTEEDLTPGLIFQKFLDDASRSICSQLMAAEQGRSREDRIYLVYADFADPPGDPAIAENLQHALLRFHGRTVPAGDPELEPWLNLHANAMEVTDDSVVAWQVVCIALFTHPDFYSF